MFLVDSEQDKVREIALPSVPGCNLTFMSSCNGLLCLASEVSSDPVIISNPITGQHIVLLESVNAPFSDPQQVGLGCNP